MDELEALLRVRIVSVCLDKATPTGLVPDAEGAEYLYRVEDYLSAYGISVRVYAYRVVSTTPKGKWIVGKRFVLDKAKRRFAHDTSEQAVKSYLARRKRQRDILEAQLERTTAVIRAIEEHLCTKSAQ